MGKGRQLSNVEIGKIEALHEEGLSNRRIAAQIGRSPTVVDNFLRNPIAYGTARRSGRPSKLDLRDKRRILRRASNSASSSATIKRELNLDVTSMTVRNVINASPYIVRARMKKAPALTDVHKARRLEFAENNMNRDWTTIVWSDEKRFKLDGPDSFNGYWYDLRKDPVRFATRNYGGGGLMVWGAFCGPNKLEIAFVDGRLNSESYQELLGEYLVPFWTAHKNDGFTFMQDGAPAHRSANTMEWLNNQNIVTLDWPACSPDLNPIENVWGIMVRRLYAGNKVYENVEQLRTAILDAWASIEQTVLNNLILSMPKRIFQLINRNGSAVDY